MRSFHIQVFFISCLHCINTSCTPFLRRHKPWVENHVPALSASQNRCEGLRLCVFCQTVSKLRSTVYPESLAEEVSNPSLKVRRSMSTRHALPCGANHRVLHLVVQALAVRHTPVRHRRTRCQSCHSSFSMVCVTHHLRPLTSQRDTARPQHQQQLVSAQVAPRHTLSVQRLLHRHTASSPCKAFF